MPAINGGVSEEAYDALICNMVESDRFEDESDALRFCVEYTLYHRYDKDV